MNYFKDFAIVGGMVSVCIAIADVFEVYLFGGELPPWQAHLKQWGFWTLVGTAIVIWGP